jgi:D-alanyl-D-alanine carboxypeptidase/D-alanyl-D-alanine-endopeptidase (penicillin-binding protein 4)
MGRSKVIRLRWLAVAAILFCGIVISGQDTRPPLLQDIALAPQANMPWPSATPLVTKTGSVATTGVGSGGVRTLFPALASVEIPGYSGVLIESMDGNVVLESNSNFTFNPASNVKIATAYAILKTFGPEYRFATDVYTDGAVDANGTLVGNLYVSGKDPMFGPQHAVSIANELNRLGIRSVSGDLIVTDNFVMNYSNSALVSGRSLLNVLDQSKRSAAATRAWLDYLSYSGKFGTVTGTPGVTFTGDVYVQPSPTTLNHLFTHESAPVREILKVTLCYSNNFLAERLGDLLGGPYSVARVVQINANIQPTEFSIQTASGLGYNRVTPNAMMRLLRSLRSDLAKYKMTFADIMPVAGVDVGTLEGRFDSDFSKGSVVGKTGTLNNTDGGVSALAGEVNTRNGKLLFVIFNQRGSVPRFRSFQNFFVSLVQGQFGGAVPIKYDAMPMDTRLARSRISYPANTTLGNE